MGYVCPVCDNEIPQGASSCPACGFKHAGATQSFKPVSVEDVSLREASAASNARALLRVVRGPQIEAVFRLGDSCMDVGRSPQCSIFLNDMTVSRLHATISPDDGGYRIDDENSFNGVWVNNKSVSSHQLVSGDVIQLGVFCLVYEEE